MQSILYEHYVHSYKHIECIAYEIVQNLTHTKACKIKRIPSITQKHNYFKIILTNCNKSLEPSISCVAQLIMKSLLHIYVDQLIQNC